MKKLTEVIQRLGGARRVRDMASLARKLVSILDKEGAPVAMSPQGQGAESYQILLYIYLDVLNT